MVHCRLGQRRLTGVPCHLGVGLEVARGALSLEHVDAEVGLGAPPAHAPVNLPIHCNIQSNKINLFFKKKKQTKKQDRSLTSIGGVKSYEFL